MSFDSLQSKIEDIQGYKPTSNDGKNMFLPFIKLFQDFLINIEEKFDDFKKVVIETTAQKNQEISLLKADVTAKIQQISKLETKLDEQDQYVRRESVVFSGVSVPAWKQAENCVDIISKLVTDKLGAEISITPKDVSVAHRLGPKPASTVDRRSIIIRFCRRTLKYDILSKARSCKPSGLFINESLTPTRQKITTAIRKAKREFPDVISGYNTVDGSIHMWVKPSNPEAPGARNSRMFVNTMEKLDAFCQRNFSLPVSHFLEPENSSRVNGLRFNQ